MTVYDDIMYAAETEVDTHMREHVTDSLHDYVEAAQARIDLLCQRLTHEINNVVQHEIDERSTPN